MPFRSGKPRSQRTTGLLLAIALVLIATGVTLYVALGHRTLGRSSAIPSSAIDLGKPPTAEGEGGLGASQNARLQFADKRDPTRLEAELAYKTLDPLGGGLYKLGQPRAWIYFRDGRTLHITAEGGRIKMPGRAQQPESGDFTGGVTIRLFPPKPGGVVDVDKDEPRMLAFTPNLSFDTALLELASDETVTISSAEMLFVGQGLVVRGNEVKDRLELVRTSGKFLRFNLAARPKPADKPKPAPAPAVAVAPAAEQTPVAAGSKPGAAPAPIRETLYRCVISDQVLLTQLGRTLTSDTLEIFARTLGNQLPDDAVGPLAFVTTGKPASADKAGSGGTEPLVGPPSPFAGAPVEVEHAAGAIAPASAAPHTSPVLTPTDEALAAAVADAGVPTLFKSAGPEDMLLTWSGSMVLAPVPGDQPPALLTGGNHLGVRFNADKPGGQPYVSMLDPKTKAVGIAWAIEYGATTRSLSLLSGPGVDNVSVYAPELGRVVVPQVVANLGTGTAQVRGGGLLSALRTAPAGAAALFVGPPLPPDRAAPRDLPADAIRQITWNDQADFQLRMLDGKVSSSLEMASFSGGVLARDRNSTIGCDHLRAEFAAGEDQGAALRRLNVTGNVIGVAGPRLTDPARPQPAIDPNLRADELDVAFQPAPGGGDVEPTYAIAKGSAVAASREARFKAGRIETRLSRDAGGDVGVSELLASDKPEFERADGVFAVADTIKADARKRTADLSGAQVIVGRPDSRIIGTRVRLDDVMGTMIVQGGGRFEHVQSDMTPALADASSSGPRSQDRVQAVATWTRGMVFDNNRGTIDCDGDATFTASGPLASDKASADQIRINVTPGSGADAAREASSGGALLAGDRRVLRAEAIGVPGREGVEGSAKNARLESYRYAPPPAPGAERVREQVFFVEGPRVIYDDLSATFSVPSSGFAIVRDERAAEAPALPTQATLGATPTTPPLLSGNMRGTARFTWAGSMTFNKAQGVVTMLRDVELAHVPMGASSATRLVGGTVKAYFGAGRGQASALTRAEASGAVYAETGPAGQQQKMFADHFTYDAQRGSAEAWADDGNRVTFYDDKRPAPLIARRLQWDLIKDRVEITEPAPIVSPR